jgi:methylenetetrahydrofolate dehydrogenase (NADP+) / methenyltetrahydrofolate cyclohydrolase
MKIIDGTKIKDQILAKIQKDIHAKDLRYHLAVISIGTDSVCRKYIQLKKKAVEQVGAMFSAYEFSDKDSEAKIMECIEFLNADPEINGIMIQIPIPKSFDRDKLISKIVPEKDVDGLRYCLGLKSDFVPPVVLAIVEAMTSTGVIPEATCVSAFDSTHALSTVERDRESTNNGSPGTTSKTHRLPAGRQAGPEDDNGKNGIVIVGHGFLVGAPLERYLKSCGCSNIVILSESEESSETKGINIRPDSTSGLDPSAVPQDDKLRKADIIISATGKPGLIKPEMIKDEAILIDAGTADVGGQLVGDIDPSCYAKSAYFTPVPGGIGPLTIAMLIKNLVKSNK